ncbi:MAG: MBL fold metallo-hydrolase, partial [Oscillospiraceae bacterium]|nr:MBL fold metallo-hydrolase [Oscillospiraceae bacterium]
ESLDAYRGMTGAPAHIHASDADFLTDPAKNLSVMLGGARSASAAEATLEDGQALPFGSGFIKVIHTPGHTKGGACFLFGDALFTGDTLFSDSVGRTDLPGGSHDELMGSIRNRILPLGGGVRIYPGHGVGCLIGELGSRNRFIAPGP